MHVCDVHMHRHRQQNPACQIFRRALRLHTSGDAHMLPACCSMHGSGTLSRARAGAHLEGQLRPGLNDVEAVPLQAVEEHHHRERRVQPPCREIVVTGPLKRWDARDRLIPVRYLHEACCRESQEGEDTGMASRAVVTQATMLNKRTF